MRYIDIGKAFSQLREEQKLSQTELAKLSGISRATINAFENGRAADIGLRKVIILFELLGQEITLKPRSKFPTLDELVHES